MDTELMQGRQQAQLAQRGPLSKQQQIITLLTKLSIRRRARLDKEDFLILSEDLMRFEMRDIEAGLDKLGLSDPAPGETAFPNAAKLVGTVRRLEYQRVAAEERKREAEAWEAHVQRCIREREEDKLRQAQEAATTK